MTRQTQWRALDESAGAWGKEGHEDLPDTVDGFTEWMRDRRRGRGAPPSGVSSSVAYIVDLDVVIRHLRRRQRTSALRRRLAGEGLLDSLVVLPVGAAEARLAAELARDRGPGLVDCHIAAAALLRRVPLVTHNHRDYRRTASAYLTPRRGDDRPRPVAARDLLL